jgi:hypothetical protein
MNLPLGLPAEPRKIQIDNREILTDRPRDMQRLSSDLHVKKEPMSRLSHRT